ncbi:MAG TPA: phosphoenolpyruvate mutase [Gammaproteobacteria bacterium]
MATNPGSKCSQLKSLLCSESLDFLMEAHNGLSARIAEEAGFNGIWASGLAIAAQFGVRDNNEASWTQVVDMLEFMSDATSIPILLDGDTGYGDFNNVRRLVKKLEQRGIAGVCIEDKLFPKTNSFIEGDRQPLADIEEFQGKIKAAKDSQADPDFCVVARVEALIAGWGMSEALRRAEAYRAAGADALLIHSKLHHPTEVLTFAAEWSGRGPLVIVPTKYYSTPTDVYRSAGINAIIWANHSLRAAISAMQSVTREIHDTQTLIDVEDRVASVSEIFRLQGAEELLHAEQRYAASTRSKTSVIVLAATRGDDLRTFTEDRPKVMIPVAGRPLLRRLVDEFKKQGLDDIHVIAGYKADAIDVQGVRIRKNEDYANSGELASLTCAEAHLKGDSLICYGDLLFRSYILRDLLDTPGEIVVAVDSAPLPADPDELRDIAYCTDRDDHSLFQQEVALLKLTDELVIGSRDPDGRWIGMMFVRESGQRALHEAIESLRNRTDFSQLGMTSLINTLLENGKTINVMYVNGHWLDVNNAKDVRRASDFAHGSPPPMARSVKP